MRKGVVLCLFAGFALVSLLSAGSAQADAGACSLSGAGREGPTDLDVFQAPDQTLEAAMIFVDFPDRVAVAGETPPSSTIGAALTGRATTYMNEVSYGQTQLQVQSGTTWLRMSQNSTAYSTSTFAGQRALMAEAIQLADAGGFNFSGRQTVIVVTSPNALPNTAAFQARANDGITVDGTNVRWGTTVGQDARTIDPRWPQYGSKVLTHELGHTFGLPDLYRVGAPTFETQHLDAGAWDVMGWPGIGTHLLAWHKQKLGWLGPADMVCVSGQATATIAPLDSPGGTKMMVAKTAPGIAYVAEVRRANGMDSELCDAGGVLVYRVNADGDNGSFPNGIAPIVVKPSDPGEPGNPSSQCAALSNALFDPPGGPTAFSEAGVTVEVLGGSPATGFSVRMTAPPPASVTPGPSATPVTQPAPESLKAPKCKRTKKKGKKPAKKCGKKPKRKK